MPHFLSRAAAHFAVAVIAAAAASSQAATAYRFTTISPVDASGVAAFGINNSGQVVGNVLVDADKGIYRGFLYQGGQFLDLAAPAGAVSWSAVGINDAGDIVGRYATEFVVDPDVGPHPSTEGAYLYRGGQHLDLKIDGTIAMEARGVSENGRYVAGFMTDTKTVGFVFDLQTMEHTRIDVGPVYGLTIAQGVNDLGIVVGSRSLPDPAALVFDAATGSATEIRLPGTDRTALRAIDNAGTMSGWFQIGDVQHGFTGYPGAFQVIDVPGADSTTVQDHNDAGWLVGTYSIGGVDHAFLATPVPEPGTWALMLAGVAVLPLTRRRRSPGRPARP